MRLLYVSPCAWACTLYVYVYNAWSERPERCAYCTSARVVERAHCTRMCTVFGMDSLSNTPIVLRFVDVGVHTVLVLVHCLAW